MHVLHVSLEELCLWLTLYLASYKRASSVPAERALHMHLELD